MYFLFEKRMSARLMLKAADEEYERLDAKYSARRDALQRDIEMLREAIYRRHRDLMRTELCESEGIRFLSDFLRVLIEKREIILVVREEDTGVRPVVSLMMNRLTEIDEECDVDELMKCDVIKNMIAYAESHITVYDFSGSVSVYGDVIGDIELTFVEKNLKYTAICSDYAQDDMRRIIARDRLLRNSNRFDFDFNVYSIDSL